jgi:inner membrane protein
VPTPISHAAVGFAIAAWTGPGAPTRRACLVAAACAALPDIDVVGSLFHVSNASLFGHRGITHSLAFAFVGAALAAGIFFRGHARMTGVLSLAFLSHACLDALSTYSVGIAFFAPFSQQRYRFLWTPLGVRSGSVGGQIIQEAVVLLVPALLVAWIGIKARRR